MRACRTFLLLPLAVSLFASNHAVAGLGASSTAACPATFFSAPFLSLPVAGPPTGVNELDFDGDGRPDLAVSWVRYVGGDVISETVISFFRRGPGGTYNLAPYEIREDGYCALGDRSGDFNADGIPDLVITKGRYESVHVVVFLGQPSGGFQRVELGSPELTNVLDASVADLNGDGRDDLIYRVYFSAAIGVSLSRGDGQFTDGPPIVLAGASWALTIADFNSDGVPDIASANNRGRISILTGQGDGTFSVATNDSIPAATVRGMAAGDLNGDDVRDLAVAGHGAPCNNITSAEDSTVFVFYGHGDGTFALPHAILVGPNPGHLAIGDLNHDGTSDLTVGLWGGFDDGCPFIAATLGRADAYAPGAWGTSIPQASGFTLGRVAVFLGGPNSLSFRGSFAAGSTTDQLFITTTGCDGVPGVVALDPGKWSVSVLQGNGDGSFGKERSLATSEFPRSVAAADLDGDGRAEAIVANWLAGTVSVVHDAGGSGAQSFEYPAGPGPNEIVVADFDHDAAQDLAVACFGAADSSFACGAGAGGVAILRGDGAGGFGAPFYIPLDGPPTMAAAGDLDRDGNLDLVVAMYSPCGGLWVLLGQGDGRFEVSRALEADFYPRRLWLADVNGDGVLDLLSSNRYRPATLALGRGDGTFEAPSDLPAVPTIAAVADVDGDGIVDIIGGDSSSLIRGMSVFIGNRDGSFVLGPRLAMGPFSPERVEAADLNGDGVIDLAAADQRYCCGLSNSAAVLFGAGGGAFSPAVHWGTGLAPSGLAVGDVDADGRPDLLVTNVDSRNLAILLNQGGDRASLAARAFLVSGARTIPIGTSNADLRVRLQPIGTGFTLEEIDVASLRMVSRGTGDVETIWARASKESRVADADNDGVADMGVVFGAADLANLFSSVRGREEVAVHIEGMLTTGKSIQAGLTLTILGRGRSPRAAVAPNPLNPTGVLRFSTVRPGPLTIRLYDIQGRLVAVPKRAASWPPGDHEIAIDGKDVAGHALASGVYLFRIDSASGTERGRLTILK